jgi:predicted MFS family arabinose efflux permease
MMANIVRREHLSNAIALNSTQFNIARMIGPLVGALALSLFGTAGCFYANAVSFLAVIWALTQVHTPANRRPSAISATGFFQSFKEGFSYLAGQRAMIWLLVALAASSVFGIPLVTLLPVFARDILKIGAAGYGVLVGAFGAGAVLSGILIAFLGDFSGKGRFVLIQMMLFVLGMAGFAFSKNLLVSVLCLLVTGFSMVGFASVTNTIIQAGVPDHLRGRAMSLFVFSFGGCMPLGNLLAGYLAKVYTAPEALLAQATALGFFVGYIYIFHPEVLTVA